MSTIPLKIQTIIHAYQRLSNVVGVVWCGSSAVGQADRWSDVDVYVLFRTSVPYQRRLIVSTDPLVDIICDSVKTAEQILSSEAGTVRRNFTHYLAHGRIVFSRGRTLQRIIHRAKRNLNRRTKITGTERTMHQYSLDDFLGEMERYATHATAYPFELNRQLFLRNATEFFLKINGGYFQPPRRMQRYLRQLNASLGRLLVHAQTATTRQEKLRSARQLHHKLNTWVGGSLRGDIRLRM